MKKQLSLVAAMLCLAAAPALAQFTNPLDKVENAVEGELHPTDAAIVQGRQQVRELAHEALAGLYEVVPGARRAVERSAGYAVFSTFGVKMFFAGGTSGKGMVVNNRSGRQTFMRMAQVQGGLGFGVSQNRLIFIFTTQEALRNFLDQGWEFGAQANVSAMAGGQGGMFTGAASVAPGVYLYQLTQNGLSATLTVAGTKFFRDPELN
jgi:lipid-binding SYLF domain-containing protein